MKINYKKIGQERKQTNTRRPRAPRHVMVLTNIWTANQICDAPASTGIVSVASGGTGALNAEAGVVTITGLTTAANLSNETRVNNSLIVATSRVIATLNNYTGVYATNGEPCLVMVRVIAGAMFFRILNTDAADALAGDVTISFQVGQAIV